MDRPIVSCEFKMSLRHFFLEILFRYAGIYLIVLSAIGLLGLIFGIAVDLRWFVVGLMFAFILIPMFLIFVYFSYALKREGYINNLPHELSIVEDGINVRLKFKITRHKESEQFISNEADEEDVNEDDKGHEGMEEELHDVKEREEFLPFETFSDIKTSGNAVLLLFKRPAKGFLWIPYDVFEQPELEKAMELMYSKIPTNANLKR